MKVLIGTTNVSKLNRFKELLSGLDVEILSLKDLEIADEPIENGKTPVENAMIKAKFYGKYFDYVICNDSGLYFKSLSIDDPRQPGLNIRTPNNKKRLSDDEMLEYYSKLIMSLGGKVEAMYLDGIAVFNKGKIYSYMDDISTLDKNSFYMVDKPSIKRHPGWPLDSISLRKDSMRYFVDEKQGHKENVMVGEYAKRLRNFLIRSLTVGE